RPSSSGETPPSAFTSGVSSSPRPACASSSKRTGMRFGFRVFLSGMFVCVIPQTLRSAESPARPTAAAAKSSDASLLAEHPLDEPRDVVDGGDGARVLD